MSLHSYSSPLQLGHREAARLFDGVVVVEEKVDGSQFSFGRFWEGNDLNLRCRSKGATLNVNAPDKMFARAVETAQELALTPGWTYRAEYLAKPKHNALAYDRTPTNSLTKACRSSTVSASSAASGTRSMS